MSHATCAHPNYEGFVARCFQLLREMIAHEFTIATIPPDPEVVVYWKRTDAAGRKYAVVNIARAPDETGMIPFRLRFYDTMTEQCTPHEQALVYYNIVPLALKVLE